MLKAVVMASLATFGFGLVVKGKGVVLQDGELLPSAVDGTRIGLTCEGGDGVSTAFSLSGTDIFSVDSVQVVSGSADYLEGDFSVEYRTTSVLVKFHPVETNAPIRQSSAVVHLLSEDESVVFSFGVGGTSIGAVLAVSEIGETAISTFNVGATPTGLNLFNAQSICSSEFTLGEVASITEGFTATLSGNRLFASYTGANTGFVEGSVTVQSLTGLGSVTLDLTYGFDGSTCTDYVINAAPWADSDGYTCDLYNPLECENWGFQLEKNGFVADQACCVCGGGVAAGDTQPEPPIVTCIDWTLDTGAPWNDNGGPSFTCAGYYNQELCGSEGDLYRNFGATANEACCNCGGGSPEPVVLTSSPTCANHKFTVNGQEIVWNDSTEDFSCDSYYTNDQACKEVYQNQGHTAQTACCACGGGTPGSVSFVIPAN